MSSRRRGRWTILAGGSLGLFIWAYDHDFFFNPGGPAAPISNGILSALHLQSMEYPVPLLVPPTILVILGMAISATVIRLLCLLSR